MVGSLADNIITPNQSWFLSVLEQLQDKAFKSAFRTCGNHDDAHDAVAEAILAVWHGIDRFEGETITELTRWFIRITLNKMNDIHRQNQKWRNLVALGEADEDRIVAQATPLYTDTNDPLDVVLAKEDKERALEALNSLSKEQRAAFLLRYSEGMSYIKAAETLDIPKGTYRNWLTNAKINLSTRLGTTDASD